MTSRTPSRPSWNSEIALLIALGGIFVLLSLSWIWVNRYRQGLVLNIDEAGYFSYAMVDYYSLHYGGLSGWLAAIDMPSIQAPLTTALTSLLFAVTGPHIVIGFAVPLAAGAGCIGLAYTLGNSLGLRRSALLGALLTAGCPVLINYSRSYLFATPAAFFATLALVAILRSRNFSSIAWTLVFGASLGLLPLARTMTVAFIPGLVAAALVSVFSKPDYRFSRLRNLGLGLLIGILVAAPWFWKNGPLVAHYLLNYGYGSHALEYGPKISVFSLQSIATKLAFILNAEIYFPEFFIICLGVLALVWMIVQAVLKDDRRRILYRAFSKPILPILIFNVTALLALCSSSNGGSGFLVPVAPALMAQTGWALCQVRLPNSVRTAVYVLAVSAAVVSAAPLAVLTPSLAREWTLNLPLFGETTMMNGLGRIQMDEIRRGYGRAGALLSRNDSEAWVTLSTWTAAMLTQKFGQQANVMFGFRNELYNVNTLNLQELIKFHAAFTMQQVDPLETGTSLAGYRDWLTKDGAQACALLTSEQSFGDMTPQVDPDFMRIAASQAGFVQVLEWPAPNGQKFALWQHKDLGQHQASNPNCVAH